eukprot:COSAG05_NODE_323_length_11408_cov_361.826156_8_plen_50_part_00
MRQKLGIKIDGDEEITLSTQADLDPPVVEVEGYARQVRPPVAMWRPILL